MGKKTAPLVLNTALGLRPRDVPARPRAQFFPIRTSRPVNNIYKFFSQASERAGFLNPRIWLANHALVTGPAFSIRPTGRIVLPLNAVPKSRSWKLAVIVNLLPVLLFHRRKVNANLSLFTFLMGRKVTVSKFNWVFEVVKVCLFVCSRGARLYWRGILRIYLSSSQFQSSLPLVVAVFRRISVEYT